MDVTTYNLVILQSTTTKNRTTARVNDNIIATRLTSTFVKVFVVFLTILAYKKSILLFLNQ